MKSYAVPVAPKDKVVNETFLNKNDRISNVALGSKAC